MYNSCIVYYYDKIKFDVELIPSQFVRVPRKTLWFCLFFSQSFEIFSLDDLQNGLGMTLMPRYSPACW